MAKHNFATANEVKTFLRARGVTAPVRVRRVNLYGPDFVFLVTFADISGAGLLQSKYDTETRTQEFSSGDGNVTARRLADLDRMLSNTNASASVA